MGRPTSLTPKLQRTVVRFLRVGNTIKDVRKHVGIGAATWNRWMNDKRPIYRAFRTAVMEARHSAKLVLVERLHRFSVKDYRAAVEFLQRRHPEEWSKRPTVIVQNEDAKRTAKLSDQELDAQLVELVSGRPDLLERIRERMTPAPAAAGEGDEDVH